MKKQLLNLGLWVALPAIGHAQTWNGEPLPTVTRFMTQDSQPATAADPTAYCIETMYRDSLGGGTTRVYYPSGKLKQYIPYANVARGVRYGCLTTWYENGQMCTKEDYVGGVRHGDLLTYYPTGILKRREHYEKGRCGIGWCYGPDGVPVPYFVYEQLPLYPGGDVQLVKELNRAMRLNSQEITAMRRESSQMHSLLQGPQREIHLELAVAVDGRIVNATVVHSTAAFLNAAALRAVAQLKRQFVPGRRDGQAMTSYLTVPVYYTVQMPYRTVYNGYRRPRR